MQSDKIKSVFSDLSSHFGKQHAMLMLIDDHLAEIMDQCGFEDLYQVYSLINDESPVKENVSGLLFEMAQTFREKEKLLSLPCFEPLQTKNLFFDMIKITRSLDEKRSMLERFYSLADAELRSVKESQKSDPNDLDARSEKEQRFCFSCEEDNSWQQAVVLKLREYPSWNQFYDDLKAQAQTLEEKIGIFYWADRLHLHEDQKSIQEEICKLTDQIPVPDVDFSKLYQFYNEQKWRGLPEKALYSFQKRVLPQMAQKTAAIEECFGIFKQNKKELDEPLFSMLFEKLAGADGTFETWMEILCDAPYLHRTSEELEARDKKLAAWEERFHQLAKDKIIRMDLSLANWLVLWRKNRGSEEDETLCRQEIQKRCSNNPENWRKVLEPIESDGDGFSLSDSDRKWIYGQIREIFTGKP